MDVKQEKIKDIIIEILDLKGINDGEKEDAYKRAGGFATELCDLNNNSVRCLTQEDTFVFRSIYGILEKKSCKQIAMILDISDEYLGLIIDDMFKKINKYLLLDRKEYAVSAFDFKGVNNAFKGKPIGELLLPRQIHDKLISLKIIYVDDLLNQDFNIVSKYISEISQYRISKRLKELGLRTIDTLNDDEVNEVYLTKLVNNKLYGNDYIEYLSLNPEEYNLLKHFGINKISELINLNRETIVKLYQKDTLKAFEKNLSIIRKVHDLGLYFSDEREICNEDSDRYIDELDLNYDEYRYLTKNYPNVVTIGDLCILSGDDILEEEYNVTIHDIFNKLQKYQRNLRYKFSK